MVIVSSLFCFKLPAKRLYDSDVYGDQIVPSSNYNKKNCHSLPVQKSQLDFVLIDCIFSICYQ